MAIARNSIRYTGTGLQWIFPALVCAPMSLVLIPIMVIDYFNHGFMLDDILLISLLIVTFGLMATFCLMQVFRPGWIEISTQSLTINRLNKTQQYSWSDLNIPKVRGFSDVNAHVLIELLRTRELISIYPWTYRSTASEISSILSEAKKGTLVYPENWRALNPSFHWKRWVHWVVLGIAVTSCVAKPIYWLGRVVLQHYL